jgi:uncharacterized protein YjbI with pentapeptide repeats
MEKAALSGALMEKVALSGALMEKVALSGALVRLVNEAEVASSNLYGIGGSEVGDGKIGV